MLNNLYIIMYALLHTCTQLFELMFRIAPCVFVVLYVDCCTTLGSAATLVYWFVRIWNIANFVVHLWPSRPGLRVWYGRGSLE